MVAANSCSPAEEKLYRQAARRWLELKEAIDAANFEGRRKALAKEQLIKLRTEPQQNFIARFKVRHLDLFMPEDMTEEQARRIIMNEQSILDNEKHEERILQQRIERGITPLSKEAV